MKWLSQVQLRRDTPQTRQLFKQLMANAANDVGHDLVWHLFADDPEATRDFLYREVESGHYLVVSERPPEVEGSIWNVTSRAYGPDLKVGSLFGFSLLANPTVAISQPDRLRSKRADVIMAEKTRAREEGRDFTPADRIKAAQSWLYAREGSLGVRFVGEADGLQIGRIDKMSILKRGRNIQLTCVDYSGVLEVTDPERLSQALHKGVGRGKAYGMGLMLLRYLD